MHTLTLVDEPRGGKPVSHAYTYPGAWHEVERKHLTALAVILEAPGTEAEARLALLKTLTGVSNEQIARMPAVEAFFLGDQLLPSLNWCFTEPRFDVPEERIRAISRMATIQHADMDWCGPGDDLMNMVFGQFAMTDNLLGVFNATKQHTDLDNALGSLYQPAHCTWSKEPIEEYATKLSTLPLEVKLAALLNYRALRAMLPAIYPNVFDQHKKEAGQGTTLGLQGVMLDVAATGVLGNFWEVESAPLHDVLSFIEHNAQKAALANNVPVEEDPQEA